ncbi:MAG: hypothetical protein WCJ28_04955 [Actinomycetota bacterium]
MPKLRLWPRGASRANSSLSDREVFSKIQRRTLTMLGSGERSVMLVLASSIADTITLDLASGAVVRLRIPWAQGMSSPFRAFDVIEVEGELVDQPEDLAQPEAVQLVGLPRQIGTLHSRKIRSMLQRLQIPQSGPLLGFRGLASPYWEFNATAPSVALVVPSRGPQLISREADGAPWVRFGWERDDVWLPLDDPASARALHAARREVLTGKDLATALGYRPHYLLVALSTPLEGHCYKVCRGLLPRS